MPNQKLEKTVVKTKQRTSLMKNGIEMPTLDLLFKCQTEIIYHGDVRPVKCTKGRSIFVEKCMQDDSKRCLHNLSEPQIMILKNMKEL